MQASLALAPVTDGRPIQDRANPADAQPVRFDHAIHVLAPGVRASVMLLTAYSEGSACRASDLIRRFSLASTWASRDEHGNPSMGLDVSGARLVGPNGFFGSTIAYCCRGPRFLDGRITGVAALGTAIVGAISLFAFHPNQRP